MSSCTCLMDSMGTGCRHWLSRRSTGLRAPEGDADTKKHSDDCGESQEEGVGKHDEDPAVSSFALLRQSLPTYLHDIDG